MAWNQNLSLEQGINSTLLKFVALKDIYLLKISLKTQMLSTSFCDQTLSLVKF